MKYFNVSYIKYFNNILTIIYLETFINYFIIEKYSFRRRNTIRMTAFTRFPFQKFKNSNEYLKSNI